MEDSNYKINVFFLVLLCIIALTACQNKAEKTSEAQDMFELINYPAWMDSLDCSSFSVDYIPYPCLGLHKKSMQEVDSLYGKPLYSSMDTLYYGWEKDNEWYTFDERDFEVTKMLSKVPVAKVTYTSRSDLGYILYLYFIEYDKQDVVFYGLRVSPHIMRD